MIYEITESGAVKCDKYTENSGKLFIGKISEIHALPKGIHFSKDVLSKINRKQKYIRRGIECCKDIVIGSMRFKDSPEIDAETIDILFLLKSDLFLLVKTNDAKGNFDNQFKEFLRSCNGITQITELLCAFFLFIMKNDDAYMEECNEKLMRLENGMVNGKTNKDFNVRLFTIKSDIEMRRIFLDDMISVCEDIVDDGVTLLDNPDITPLGKFQKRAKDYKEAYEYLVDSAVHLREAYDAEIDNTLNRTMKILSVVSTVFLPLMFIVGWYGMNFKNMPELSWDFAYPGVFIICSGITIGMVIFFKVKKLI